MRVVVIDGQGGGVGKALVEQISQKCPKAEVVAVGTNSMATANMLKGAKIVGATGENAVLYNSRKADVIVGPMGIIRADAMLGEITSGMAEAIASSAAQIMLVPMSKCGIYIAGVQEKKIADYIEDIAVRISEL